MSEPLAGTGVTKVDICPDCGAEATFGEYTGCYGSAPRFLVTRHAAPCGFPCLAGGVKPDVYRSGNYHSKNRCPKCANTNQPQE